MKASFFVPRIAWYTENVIFSVKHMNEGKYVDGFVLVIPADKVDAYKKMAEEGRDTWMKYGALAYYECRGEDLVP